MIAGRTAPLIHDAAVLQMNESADVRDRGAVSAVRSGGAAAVVFGVAVFLAGFGLVGGAGFAPGLGEAHGQLLAQAVQPLGFAYGAQCAVAGQRQHHDVAAQRRFGVVAALGEALQAAQQRRELLQGQQVLLRGGDVENRRDQRPVLFHHQEGVFAERLGLVAHADQAAAFGRGQRDEAGEQGFELGDGGVRGGQLFVGEAE